MPIRPASRRAGPRPGPLGEEYAKAAGQARLQRRHALLQGRRAPPRRRGRPVARRPGLRRVLLRARRKTAAFTPTCGTRRCATTSPAGPGRTWRRRRGHVPALGLDVLRPGQPGNRARGRRQAAARMSAPGPTASTRTNGGSWSSARPRSASSMPRPRSCAGKPRNCWAAAPAGTPWPRRPRKARVDLPAEAAKLRGTAAKLADAVTAAPVEAREKTACGVAVRRLSEAVKALEAGGPTLAGKITAEKIAAIRAVRVGIEQVVDALSPEPPGRARSQIAPGCRRATRSSSSAATAWTACCPIPGSTIARPAPGSSAFRKSVQRREPGTSSPGCR